MKIFRSFVPEVIELLEQGAVGVMPTDTVYGLVAPLFNEAAVNRIYSIKDRPATQPVGTILINDPLQVEHVTDPAQLLAAQVFWPAPTSVIITVSKQLQYAHRGYGSLPFRIPANPELQELLNATGPLATTSANRAGQPPAATLEEALAYFRSAVDFYVDGGDLGHRKASQIIRFNERGEPEVVRT